MSSETILIVDDNLINLKLLRILLTVEGYLVHTAGDANEALSLLETINPHLILMDLQLPDIDGLELTRMLKANPLYTDTIIIAITAYAMKGDDQKALRAGCNGYISKPVDINQILEVIRSFLTKSNKTQKG